MASDQNVKVVINGEDKTGPAIKSASAGFNNLRGQVADLTKVVGGGLLVAGGAAVAFLYSSAKAAAEAEVQMARVDAILNTMGDSAIKNRDAILGAADAAVQLGFDDEDAAESITRLYQRTNDLTKAQELSNLAMDLARAKNIELSTATDLVGQVLSGNGRALKAYGIEINETMEPLEALGVLHEKVKGQSEAFASTFAGQMQTLSIEMNNFKETIGAALLEAIQPFIKDLTKWANDPATQQQIKQIATAIGNFAKVALPIAIDAVKILVGWFKAMYDALVAFEVKVIQTIDAVTRLAKAVANNSVIKAIGGTVKGAVAEVKYLSGARASGGPVMAGGSYLVGEKGPEIFTPSRSGNIIPNGGGGTVVNIYNPVMTDPAMVSAIGDEIVRMLGRDLRY